VDLDPVTRCFSARDGLELAFRQVGDGRPLILLHGFTGDGRQWIDHGHAVAFADRGHRVILPDLRGHGASARPHEAAAYPPDVLADDGLALVEALGPDDSDPDGYDQAGYSLGGRVVLRILARGAWPARAVVAGQGLHATSPATDRTDRYRRLLTATIEDTALEPEERVMADWLAHSGADPWALLGVLDSLVATTPQALSRDHRPDPGPDRRTGHPRLGRRAGRGHPGLPVRPGAGRPRRVPEAGPDRRDPRLPGRLDGSRPAPARRGPPPESELLRNPVTQRDKCPQDPVPPWRSLGQPFAITTAGSREGGRRTARTQYSAARTLGTDIRVLERRRVLILDLPDDHWTASQRCVGDAQTSRHNHAARPTAMMPIVIRSSRSDGFLTGGLWHRFEHPGERLVSTSSRK
jgi:pimeloyl-ACP methyl ester carboxylesterase